MNLNDGATVYRPLMSDAEFSQLITAIWAVRPRTFLEWGSGGSTQTILGQCAFIEKYVSIEHDSAWYERVRQAVIDPRLSLHLVEPARPEPPRRILNITKRRRNRYRREGERDPVLFEDYAQFPKQLGLTYDFVLVDGRARSFCLDVGWSLLNPGGMLALHDAQRHPGAEVALVVEIDRRGRDDLPDRHRVERPRLGHRGRPGGRCRPWQLRRPRRRAAARAAPGSALRRRGAAWTGGTGPATGEACR